ncbi:MAG: DUF3280 domain-containing protein [Methylomonas sp.]|nr:DUF3280 domain-containing protein [Methylomonas sp.]
MTSKLIFALLLPLLLGHNSNASPRIAVLDFELNDISSLPNTPTERQRTASLRPLLERSVRQSGDYTIVRISADAQLAANPGFGYLFHFHDLAADLGRKYGADWVVVGQHSKPSFLYSYLLVHLVDVRNRTLGANFAVELKGNHEKVTQHGAKAMASKIAGFLERQ